MVSRSSGRGTGPQPHPGPTSTPKRSPVHLRPTGKLAKQKHFYPESLLDRRRGGHQTRGLTVVLATPVSTHFPLGKLALQCDKHLFVEKPFTATAREAGADRAAASA